MKLTDKESNILQKEIDHILDSGANSIRFLEMIDNFLADKSQTIKSGLDWIEIKKEQPIKNTRIWLYNISNDSYKSDFVHEYDLTTGKYPHNWTHWALIDSPI